MATHGCLAGEYYTFTRAGAVVTSATPSTRPGMTPLSIKPSPWMTRHRRQTATPLSITLILRRPRTWLPTGFCISLTGLRRIARCSGRFIPQRESASLRRCRYLSAVVIADLTDYFGLGVGAPFLRALGPEPAPGMGGFNSAAMAVATTAWVGARRRHGPDRGRISSP